MGFFESLIEYRHELIKFQVAVMLVSFAGTILIVSVHHFLKFWIPYEFYKHDPQFMQTLYKINAKQDKSYDWRWAFYAAAVIVVMLGLIIGQLLALAGGQEAIEHYIRYG